MANDQKKDKPEKVRVKMLRGAKIDGAVVPAGRTREVSSSLAAQLIESKKAKLASGTEAAVPEPGATETATPPRARGR